MIFDDIDRAGYSGYSHTSWEYPFLTLTKPMLCWLDEILIEAIVFAELHHAI